MQTKVTTKILVAGKYTAILKRPNGETKIFFGKNLVVTQGLANIAAQMAASSARPSWIAIGDSGTAVSATQTALVGSEWQRIAMTATSVANALVLSATITGVVAQRNVQEMGIFTASTGAALFSRFLPAAFDFEVGATLACTWQLEFS